MNKEKNKLKISEEKCETKMIYAGDFKNKVHRAEMQRLLQELNLTTEYEVYEFDMLSGSLFTIGDDGTLFVSPSLYEDMTANIPHRTLPKDRRDQ